MPYTINVSNKGKHVFATAEHSASDYRTAEQLYFLIYDRFPEEDGYYVTASYVETSGQTIKFERV